MKLKEGLHLAYCTNIHRGETWAQTFATLQDHTLKVKARVSAGAPYAIGLRLGDQTARELSDPATLLAFQRWLLANDCYVFTINGFPYGRFHGGRVKEEVYRPDWTTRERLDYTTLLFELLGELVPSGMAGSVSTVPCSYKEFISSTEQEKAMRDNLWRAVEQIERISIRTGRELHLGLEPEPLCYLETSEETVRFFEQLRQDRPGDDRLSRYLGVNYDTCHLACEYEEPRDVIENFQRAGIKISKLHFSSALKVTPNAETRVALQSFVDVVYFHQVIARTATGALRRYRDLDVALAQAPVDGTELEWRIHFHVPLHAAPTPLFATTSDHMIGVMDLLQKTPSLCSHIEMETYTWEVLPGDLKKRDVVDQLVGEYEWTLNHLRARGLA